MEIITAFFQEVLKHSSVQHIDCVTNNAALDEVISHYFSFLPTVNSDDPRVHYHSQESQTWLKTIAANTFDLIIYSQPLETDLHKFFQPYYLAMREQGIFVFPWLSSLFHLDSLKSLVQMIPLAGFHDWQTLHFPQPSYSMGWRTTVLAMKCNRMKRIREKDVFNRHFSTRYYNFDTHKAALAIPEFMRETLEKAEECD